MGKVLHDIPAHQILARETDEGHILAPGGIDDRLEPLAVFRGRKLEGRSPVLDVFLKLAGHQRGDRTGIEDDLHGLGPGLEEGDHARDILGAHVIRNRLGGEDHIAVAFRDRGDLLAVGRAQFTRRSRTHPTVPEDVEGFRLFRKGRNQRQAVV